MEQMRSEFEAWVTDKYGKKFISSYEINGDGRGYELRVIQSHWEAWQASRQAVEIELPMPAYSREEIQAVATHRVILCKSVIRAAGLRIKGE